ncbi:hypothetical protein GS8_1940 [Geobacillus stearothermophilus]|uniref:Uncharacterized protein n=1 Tax=Geobacillus stearothermophilus TaxID=1422 RepID=A0ABQ7HC62_GEOSE|nr:hypothetical protein GS8_1940 [Geobacillus stearothermophilus]
MFPLPLFSWMPFLYDHYTTEWALEADGNKKEALFQASLCFHS